jgi:hypothetical protein
MLVLKLPISEEQLAQLEGEGDFAFFAPLTIHGEQKVLHVHLRHRKFYDLVYSASRIKDGGHKNINPPLVEGARLEVE